MKYYKNENGEVFAFSSAAEKKAFRPDLVEMSAQEVESHLNPAKTPVQIEAEKVAAVQAYMDSAAQALRYDNIASAITYAEEPAVPKFQAEGQAFRAWRSLVWAKCYEILDDVNDGKRSIPTDDELIGELPELVI